MTTKLLPISSITIARHERQRKTLVGIDSLAASLRRNGQINPITVTSDLILIAGERRLTAATHLGWDSILATIRDEEPTEKQRLLELEENLEREELPWKDHCLAIYDLHTILSEREGWTAGKTAKYTGQSSSEISRRLSVARALLDGDEFVAGADRFSVAVNFLARKAERAEAEEANELAQILDGLGDEPPLPLERTTVEEPDSDWGGSGESEQDLDIELDLGLDLPVERPPVPFLNVEFQVWLETYDGPKFNFVHCDFPYGINVDKHDGSGSSFKGYSDTKDVFFDLLETFSSFTRDHVAESAHLMFWYSPEFEAETRTALAAMGWVVQTRPLIWWRSDNSGVLPDPKRGPRWVYETCLMATRGDRPIVQAVANLKDFPNVKAVHKSEKPFEMLAHFFRMFVDENTRMIDPTMGSGNAVHVAEAMGAKTALGLERDPEFFQAASTAYNERKDRLGV